MTLWLGVNMCFSLGVNLCSSDVRGQNFIQCYCFVSSVGFGCFYRLFKQGLRLAVILALIFWKLHEVGGKVERKENITQSYNQVSFSVSKLAISKLSKLEETGAPGWLSRLSIQLSVLAQVMISRFHEFEPHIRFCADSADLASDPLSPPLSAPPGLALALSQKYINIKIF